MASSRWIRSHRISCHFLIPVHLLWDESSKVFQRSFKKGSNSRAECLGYAWVRREGLRGQCMLGWNSCIMDVVISLIPYNSCSRLPSRDSYNVKSYISEVSLLNELLVRCVPWAHAVRGGGKSRHPPPPHSREIICAIFFPYEVPFLHVSAFCYFFLLWGDSFSPFYCLCCPCRREEIFGAPPPLHIFLRTPMLCTLYKDHDNVLLVRL